MEGSREKSSGPPPPRADEIPAAIDDVLNRIRVIFDLWKKRFYSFLSRSDDKEGVWGADGEPGGAAHQDHHGQLHHCHLWGNGDCSVFSIFSRFFPMVAMILHLFFSAFDNNLHLQVSRLANTAKSVVRDLDNGLFRISQVFGNFFFYISRPK